MAERTQAQLDFVPEPLDRLHPRVFGEEFGLMGTVNSSSLHALIGARGMMIAANASTVFPRSRGSDHAHLLHLRVRDMEW